MRYVTRAAKPLFIETPLWDDAEPLRLSISVDGEKSIDTGLVDARGNPIHRVQEPIGFRTMRKSLEPERPPER